MLTRWRELVVLQKRLVSVASDETVTTHNKETHMTLNRMPDQVHGTSRRSVGPVGLVRPTKTLITFCSRFA